MFENVQQIFVDGINHINFINGMVRINMGVVVPGETEQSEPSFKETHQLIIPLNSFLNAFESQKQLIEQLEANEIITKQPENPAAPTEAIVPEIVQ